MKKPMSREEENPALEFSSWSRTEASIAAGRSMRTGGGVRVGVGVNVNVGVGVGVGVGGGVEVPVLEGSGV